MRDTEDPDGLFVRHTYLATVVGLAVQSAFGVDIRSEASHAPTRLLDGSAFNETTGVRGVIESDFFGWPGEISAGATWIRELANRVASYDWTDATTTWRASCIRA